MPRGSLDLEFAVPPAPPSLVTRSLTLELLRARELVLRRFRPVYHAHDLTEQQWRVLRVIVERGTCSMQVLAEACCIHPPSLSRMIPKLLARGLLHRRADAHDQRRAEISITPDGRRFHDAILPEVVQVHARLEAELGRERIGRVLDTVTAFAETLGGGTAPFSSGPGEAEDDGSGQMGA